MSVSHFPFITADFLITAIFSCLGRFCLFFVVVIGASSSKQMDAPDKGTPAWYIHTHKGPRFCKFLLEWHALTAQDPKRQFPLSRTFDRDKLNFL